MVRNKGISRVRRTGRSTVSVDQIKSNKASEMIALPSPPGFDVRKSRFTEFFIQLNGLDTRGFEGWVFDAGMLFNDIHVWWRNGGVRRQPHEGVDFYCYRDRTGQYHRLNETIKVPVMYDGTIVHIGDDFLGMSLYVSHTICDDRGNKLHTIYGHVKPYNNGETGKFLREGDMIATIADAGKKKAHVPSHLHVSTAWLPQSFPYERLDWETMSNRGIVTLSDPMEFIHR